MDYLSFDTERLVLKPTSSDDAEFIYELLNTPEWKKYIGDRKIETIDDAAAYIENKIRPQLKRLGFSNYTVIRKEDGAKIGTCGLYDRDGIDGVDIGYALLPEYQKKGYAYEASERMKQAAFETFNQTKVSAITLKENKNSRLLLERLGFAYRHMIRIPNDNEDLMLYELQLEQE